MLKILLSEYSRMRLDDVEQLGDDGCHPPEMTRPGKSAQVIGKIFESDVGFIIAGIKAFLIGCKDGVNALFFSCPGIFFKLFRITVKILVGAKLGGIDKNA